MRTRLSRLASAVVVALSVGLVAACGSGPSQVGSAVIVGNQAVPLGTVQSRLDVALGHPDLVAAVTRQGAQTADLSREIVTRSVLHALLTEAAAREGITVSDAQVTAQLAQLGGEQRLLENSLFAPDSLREYARDRIVATELAKRYVDRLVVTFDLAAAQNRADAESKARTAAAGGPAADALFADPRTSQRAITYRASTDPQAASQVIFGTPAGRAIAFQPSPGQGSWFVLRITNRTIEPAAPAGAGDPAARIDSDSLVAIGERLTQPLGDELGIEVNPRYGVWDPIQLRVVAPDQEAGTIVAPPATP